MNTFLTTRNLYNQHAAKFADKFEQIPETQQLDEFIAMLPAQAKVLDLGCGSGRDAEYLTRAGLQVIGVDLSSALIAEAKKRRPNIDFRVMDMERLDFPEHDFDAVWSKLAILHVARERLPAILRTVHAVLKPGGVCMMETKQGAGEGAEPVSFSPGEERHFVYYELDELMTLFKNNGYVDVQGYKYTVGNEHATAKKDRVVVWGRKTVAV